MASKNKNPLRTDVSPVKSLFLGSIEEQNIFPFPAFPAEEREAMELVLESIDKALDGRFSEFRKFDKEGKQSDAFIQELRELGLFGLIIPEEYGGIGLSNTGYSRALQQVSRHDGSTALTVGAHSSIGMKGLVLFGTPDQKAKYLPKLASGEMIAAFCLTEPGAGSDAASIRTSATKEANGDWILNGEKIWITNGPIADFFTVFAKTDTDKGKMTGFIVERSPGVTSGHHEDKMGIRGSATSTVNFQNVRVPASNVLGEEGKGFKVAMAILNNGRTGLGGGCVGAMKRCIALASRQAKDRKQFGRSISEFLLIKEKIAQMTIQCFAAESVVSMVGYYIDSGVEDYSVEAALSKVFASESLWQVGNDALQIAGGNGFMKDFPYEMVVRDSRINLIFEGTNDILRMYIALSCLNEVGSFLKDIGKGVMDVFKDPIKGFGVLSEYAGKKLTEITKVGRDKISKVHPTLREEATLFEKYTLSLSQVAEQTVRKLKKDIVGSQLVTKRFADIAIDVFVGMCVLSRVTSLIEAKGKESCNDEIMMAKVFTQQAKRRISTNLRRFLHNEDDSMRSLGDSVFASDGYRWDSL